MTAGSVAVLLERDAELTQLSAALDDAASGHGRLVYVEGAAGIGKSALLDAAARQARGVRVLRARGSEFEREFAFGVVRQLLEPLLAGAGEAERARLLAGAAAPAEWVVAAMPDVDADRAEASFAVLHALYWLISHAASARPLALLADDVHWADVGSLRALGYLARRIADLPVALIVAARPLEPGAPAALLDDLRAGAAARIDPGALGDGAVARIVRAELAGAGDDLCRACAQASGGNPFYLRELLLALRADGVARRGPGAVADASSPSIGDRVLRRVAGLDPAAAGLARSMAVLGDGGRLAVAAAVAGLDEPRAAAIAAGLRRIDVLAAEDPIAFSHSLVRRSIHDALSVTERDALHAAAAGRLRAAGAAPEAVAAHLQAVRPTGSSAVATSLADAARDALSRAAPEAAIAALRRALDEGSAAPPRPELLLELGLAEMVVRDPAAVAHLREALDLAREPVQRGRIAAALSELLCVSGQWEAGSAIVTEIEAELGADAPELVVELKAFQAVTMAYDPRLSDRFDRDLPRLRALSAGDRWGAHALKALLAAVDSQRGERLDAVVGLVDAALADGRLLGERGAGGWATAQALTALVSVEALDRAAEVGEDVLAEGRRSGALLGVLTGQGYRGWIQARRGDLAGAEADFRACVGPVLDSGMELWLTTAFAVMQDVLLERPAFADVVALLDRVELEPVFLDTVSGAMLLDARGRVRLARGDRVGAVDDLRHCGTTYDALRFGPLSSSWRSALALALPAGDRDEALALAAEELALAEATGLERPQGIALRAAGLVAGGGPGIGQLEASVAVLERAPAALEHARSRVELGAALRRHGRRVDARGPLAAGLEQAHRCGAVRLAQRARDELLAAGARPRRVARTGVAALTASELRVARLAAEGRSNPEIAQELYLSLKTVETHLSRAYAKLGLSGQGARRGLASALAAPGPG